jgi:hypothetical protein
MSKGTKKSDKKEPAKPKAKGSELSEKDLDKVAGCGTVRIVREIDKASV